VASGVKIEEGEAVSGSIEKASISQLNVGLAKRNVAWRRLVEISLAIMSCNEEKLFSGGRNKLTVITSVINEKSQWRRRRKYLSGGEIRRMKGGEALEGGGGGSIENETSAKKKAWRSKTKNGERSG
jgi:hypothetical protein